MKQKIIYIAMTSLLLPIISCSDKEQEFQEHKTPLKLGEVVTRANATGDKCEPFEIGDKIKIYYAHSNLQTTYPFNQGEYECAKADIDEPWGASEWINMWRIVSQGIYVDDISYPNLNDRYIFTGVTMPIPFVDKNVSRELLMVQTDQASAKTETEWLETNDFLAARASYKNKSDWENGLRLHFRHLLCRIQVELLLPKGTKLDGYFSDPVKLSSSATINKKYHQYMVVFDSTVPDEGLFDTNTKGIPDQNINMFRKGAVMASLPEDKYGGRETAIHTFEAILPLQKMQETDLMTFVIAGEKYTYKPSEVTKIELKPEHILRLRLVLLSQAPEKKVELLEIETVDWKNDTADVGSLLPENN